MHINASAQQVEESPREGERALSPPPADPALATPRSFDPRGPTSPARNAKRVHGCEWCTVLPEGLNVDVDATERLLVYAPAPLALGKVRRAAAESGYTINRLDETVVMLDGSAGDWRSLLNALDLRLSALEANETRVVPIGSASVDTFSVTMAALKARAVPTLLAEIRDGWLKHAIESDGLTSYFQPIVDVATGAIYAQEALLRAALGDGQVASGSRIVDAGRRVGALHLLDQLGRTSAIRCAHRLSLHTNLLINFFPGVVYDSVYSLQTTLQAMRETGTHPKQVIFEVAESEQIADRGHLQEILTDYRRQGFRIALDDLGSGYSSLNLMVALRPDFVKLDMEVAREIATNSLRRALVQALVSTAHDYGIQVIAEGVETIENARILAGMGIRLLQGYLFGQPAPSLGTLDPEVLHAIR
jgi:EAL domain-containing protein (putative c-di-GMP-specific phosphodiesterase class I)